MWPCYVLITSVIFLKERLGCLNFMDLPSSHTPITCSVIELEPNCSTSLPDRPSFVWLEVVDHTFFNKAGEIIFATRTDFHPGLNCANQQAAWTEAWAPNVRLLVSLNSSPTIWKNYICSNWHCSCKNTRQKDGGWTDLQQERHHHDSIMTKCFHHPHCRPKTVPCMWENRRVLLAAARTSVLMNFSGTIMVDKVHFHKK